MDSEKADVNHLAEKGRGGDDIVGHLAPDDLIIPKELQSPALRDMLRTHFETHGGDIDRYTAGNEKNSKNPETGMPEFNYWKKLRKIGGNILSNPATQILSDVVAASTGNAWAIPLINAGERSVGGLAKGESLGKALGQGALSGAEAFAGQEVLGAAANAFPETAGSLGLDTSGNSLTDMLGQTSGAGSLTGPGTIGGNIGNLFSSTPTGAVSSSFGESLAPNAGGTASINSATGLPGESAASAMTAVGAGGAAQGGPAALGPAAPGGFSSDTSNIDAFLNSNTATINSGTGGVSAPAAAPGAGGLYTGFGSQPGGANIPGAIEGPNSAFTPAAKGEGLLGMLKSNPAALIGAGGLAANLIKGNQPVKGENQIGQAAAADTAAGEKLQSYLPTGTLPPGAQASINSAANSQKAAIKSRYASMGNSGSSAEIQDLAAVDQWSQGQGSQLALQLLNSGIEQSHLGSALYQDIAKNAMEQDKELGSAFSNFASSLGGGYNAHPGQTILNTQPA